MTQNQIAYWNLQETERHNKAGEDENKRHNVTTEGETFRHNYVTEQVSIADLNERGRHNRATEYETSRHNMETESQGRQQLAETNRHNLETERQGRTNLDIQLSSLNETIRHNQAGEKENYRHNLAQESYNMANLSETQRSNLENERRRREELAETGRHNLATEKTADKSANASMLAAQARKEANAIQAARNAADKEINEARLAISKYEQLDKRRLSSAQVKEINASIRKMNQDISSSKTQQTTSIWQQINNSAAQVVKLIDAVIPF